MRAAAEAHPVGEKSRACRALTVAGLRRSCPISTSSCADRAPWFRAATCYNALQ